jgi:hypothetical protein
MEAQWNAEYRYRKLFNGTHQQYLDEPLEVITWMLRIEEIYNRIEAEKQKESQGS